MFKENKGEVLHGILLIVLFSFSAFYIAEFEFVKQLSFSPLIVGIILGMLYYMPIAYATNCPRHGFQESSFVPNKSCAQA